MRNDRKRKVCVITGATRGLGYALAKKYSSEGFYVIGLATNQALLEAMITRKLLKEFIICDLADSNSITKAIRKIKSNTKSIDMLVHNAAIQQSFGIGDSVNYTELFEHEFTINTLAPVQVTEALIPQLSRAKGNIIIISSLLKYAPKSSAPGYCASKAALASWINSLRFDVQCYDITVSEIIPGLIKTDMSEKAKEKGVDPKVLADWIYTTRKGGVSIGPGARLGWWIQRIMPNVFAKLMLSM